MNEKREESLANQDEERTFSKNIEQRLIVWKRRFYICWFLHYFLGLLGIASAITVAIRPSFLWKFALDILAWIAAISIVLITFLTPSRQASAYNKAWIILSNAYDKYKMKLCSAKEVLNARQKGESIIMSKAPS